MQTPLDYLGFCLWSIVKKNGLLVPGKPNLGVFKFNEKYCVFSDRQAIEEFVANPAEFLEEVIQQCKKNPELIHLLRLNEEFENANLNFLMEANQHSIILSNKLMVDKTCQTPTHFVERYMDRNHCFSEWELRKNAI